MVRLFGEDLTRAELLRRIGSLDQIGGVRRIRLEDGPEDGVSAVEVRTGGGLSYTVVPSRSLDIAAAECDGVPIAWRSGAGEMHPAYIYRTIGWNVGWFGGLLATCGMDNIGSPGEDELGTFAQHGHVNGVAARHVGYGGRWEGDQYVMWVEGELRQKDGWMPGSYDVVLRRRIESMLGGRTIAITDTVENLAGTAAPLMLMYHVNVGYPLVAPEARILVRSRGVTRQSGDDADVPEQITPPIPDYAPGGYSYEPIVGDDGMGEAALINSRLERGVLVRFRAAELPFFRVWKALVHHRNVVGLEPSNSRGGNRIGARANGVLTMLQPGEERTFRVELTALRGADEIDQASRSLTSGDVKPS